MSKTLDWSKIATVNFDDNRRKFNKQTTGKELFAKAYADLKKSEDLLAQRKEIEPILKKALLEHMVNHTPIKVMQPINNPTETVGGLNKSENEEEDNFYYNGGRSNEQNQSLNVKFEETMEVIPPGVELVYKAWDRQLNQWLFKGSNGQEYAIYEKPVIIFQGQAIENPGLFGLLFNTSITEVLSE